MAEVVEADRLDHVEVEACPPGPAQVFFLAVPRQGDEHRDSGSGPGSGEFPEMSGHLVPVHPRQPDVEEDQVERVGGDFFNGRRPVVDDANVVSPMPQDTGEAERGVFVVVDDKRFRSRPLLRSIRR